jgi:hypothetical protein
MNQTDRWLLREWPLGFVFVCILFMLHPMLHADFGMIDDHEIMRILGRENAVKQSEFFPLIGEYAIEHNGRFRPGYYVLWILEAFFVGSNAGLWYANRLVFALVSALSLYVAIRMLLQPLPAGIVTLLFFSGAQNEIWIRLGTAECYGVPLLLGGVAWIAVQLQRHKWRPAQLFPGFALLLLAGFMKESFIPVFPAAVVFIYLVLPFIFPFVIPDRDHLKRLDGLILFLLMSGLAAQTVLTVTMLRTYGHQYASEISMISFLAAIKPMLVSYSKSTLWFVPVAVGLVTLLPRNPREWREQGWRRDLMKLTVLLTVSGVLLLGPQLFLHGGDLGFAGRYLIPGNLFIVFAAALGFYSLSSSSVQGNHAELRGVVAGMLIVVAFSWVLGTYREANAAARSSHKFQAKLAEIVRLKTQHPELPLLFYSTDVFDREPLISVASYLATRLPALERPFLNTFHWETGADSLRKIKLAKLIREESIEGDKFFAKISSFPATNGRCIAVIFSGFRENFHCDYSVHIYES